jgi:hypothetical protein
MFGDYPLRQGRWRRRVGFRAVIRIAVQRRLVDAYVSAREEVISRGFAFEIDWHYLLDLNELTEMHFLRESAWVILNSGMREAVIRRKFLSLSSAFCHWKSASAIVRSREVCRRRALAIFGHARKIEAIIAVAAEVESRGFDRVREGILTQGVDYLRTFSYIGSVTKFHLAKNLGMDVVKPDRHLMRVAERLGMESPVELCWLLARETGDRVGIVDVVIWRFATLRKDYLDHFAAES